MPPWKLDCCGRRGHPALNATLAHPCASSMRQTVLLPWPGYYLSTQAPHPQTHLHAPDSCVSGIIGIASANKFLCEPCVFAVKTLFMDEHDLHGPGQPLDRFPVSPSPCRRAASGFLPLAAYLRPCRHHTVMPRFLSSMRRISSRRRAASSNSRLRACSYICRSSLPISLDSCSGFR
jgi:hypothetical protein